MNKWCFFTLWKIFVSDSNTKASWLIVRAIWTWHKLTISFISWEPCFQIIFHCSSIIQCSWNNLDNLIWKLQWFIKFFRCCYHFFQFVPRVLRLAKNELFNLLKLMDSENTPYISTVRSSLLSETWWVTCISKWQISWFYPFISMHSWNWLFWSCDQVKWLFSFISSFNLIQVFFKVIKLAGFMHYWWFHEVWWLKWSVFSFVKSWDTVIDQRLIQHNTKSLKIVTQRILPMLLTWSTITMGPARPACLQSRRSPKRSKAKMP